MFSNAIGLCSEMVTTINVTWPLVSFKMTASVANESETSRNVSTAAALPLPTASAET